MTTFNDQLAAMLSRGYSCYCRRPWDIVRDIIFPLITALCLWVNGLAATLIIPIEVLFALSLLGHVCTVLVDTVNDKTEKYREYLMINGLSHNAYLFSNMIYQWSKCLIFTVMIFFGLALNGGYSIGFVLGLTLLYLLTAVGVTNLALMFTTFFTDRDLCLGVGTILYIVVSLFYLAALAENSGIWYGLSLLFPQNGLALDVTVGQGGTILVSLFVIFVCVFFDLVFYGFLYYYLDQVLPDETGLKKKWDFIFSDAKKDSEDKAKDAKDEGERLVVKDEEDDSGSAFHYEPFPNEQKLAKSVLLKKVSKSYDEQKAVDELSLSLYEKQIICLLGHNGAGKTTTINILTGLTNSDSGDIYYHGKLIKNDNEGSRKEVGLCCQQNILYDVLTPKEHLELIGRIRGLKGTELTQEVNRILASVDLEYHNTSAANLSGGSKRKLCLGLAMVGNPKIIFLDEPTSGLDAKSRRTVWEIIKKLKEDGKTILLTTHHLDEADELSDRLAIMSRGKLFALGSSDFIKKKFGEGYHLIITPDFTTLQNISSVKSTVQRIFTQNLPDARLDDNTNDQLLQFRIPFSGQSRFSRLFSELENVKGIKLNLQMNSLEDAFVNIGLNEGANILDKDVPRSISVSEPQGLVQPPEIGFFNQVIGMFSRKFYNTVRNFKLMTLLIMPLIFVFLGLYLLQNAIQQFLEEEDVPALAITVTDSIVFLFLINIAYILNSTLYAYFPVNERELNIKFQTSVMGLGRLSYWFGTLLFDLCTVSILNLGFIAMVYYFGMTNIESWRMVWTIYVYSFAIITCSYMWSFIFDKTQTLVKTYSVFYIFVLFLLPYLIALMISDAFGSPTVFDFFRFFLYYLCPTYAFNEAIFLLVLGQFAQDFELNPMFATLEQADLYLLWLGVFYFLITLLLDYWVQRAKSFGVSKSSYADMNNETADARDEARRVRQPECKDIIKAQNLRKTFEETGFTAVKNATFGVNAGEVMGLLGPNGAGKSTTFNMVTTFIPRNRGEITLKLVNVDDGLSDVYPEIGICPQFDALWPDLTVEEHIRIYCRIKGVPSDRVDILIAYLSEALDLKEALHKNIRKLSGGTKRKLCSAISLVGNSLLLFLDEPSTGLDPLAKRHLWALIKKAANNQNVQRRAAVLLTTHSMEEAEDLCSKIGIMVNGRFQCFGPLNYLKNAYGSGYKLVLIKKTQELDRNKMLSFEERMKGLFSTAKLLEIGVKKEVYQIPVESLVFSRAFGALDQMKAIGDLEDFSIYNTTLEQVFIHFAKDQINSDSV